MLKYIAALTMVFSTAISFAGRLDPIPDRIIDLHGAFKGKSVKTKKTAHLLVFNIKENGQPSGRFNIYLLHDREKGQVFEAEILDQSRLALLAVGKNNSGEFIESKLPVAGTLEIQLESLGRGGANLYLQSKDRVLSESYKFEKRSNDIKLGRNLVDGVYEDRKNRNQGLVARDGHQNSTAVRAILPTLGLEGDLIGVPELEGIVVLREEEIDNNLNAYFESHVSAAYVPIIDGRKDKIVIGKIADDGRMVPVRLLNKDK